MKILLSRHTCRRQSECARISGSEHWRGMAIACRSLSCSHPRIAGWPTRPCVSAASPCTCFRRAGCRRCATPCWPFRGTCRSRPRTRSIRSLRNTSQQQRRVATYPRRALARFAAGAPRPGRSARARRGGFHLCAVRTDRASGRLAPAPPDGTGGPRPDAPVRGAAPGRVRPDSIRLFGGAMRPR